MYDGINWLSVDKGQKAIFMSILAQSIRVPALNKPFKGDGQCEPKTRYHV